MTGNGQLCAGNFNGFTDEAMTWTWARSILTLALLMGSLELTGCTQPPPQYGVEQKLILVGSRRQTWAVAPAVNVSGQREVDPILQADLLYQQLQQVRGLTVIPVNRVAEVFASLHIEQVRSEEEAALVCEVLGCDGLLVPTVTIYDPFAPPKLGGSLTLMRRQRTAGANAANAAKIDVRELVRESREADLQESRGSPAVPEPSEAFVQVVGMYDAANGSVRDAVLAYAEGRNDPLGPYGAKEYLVSMDRYCGFVYHELIANLLSSPRLKRAD